MRAHNTRNSNQISRGDQTILTRSTTPWPIFWWYDVDAQSICGI